MSTGLDPVPETLPVASALPAGGTVTVRVPATSANLGPAFDAAGLALGVADEVSVTVLDEEPGTLRIEVRGEGADSVPRGADHLVVRCIDRALTALGAARPALLLRCHNSVPHGRGMGSSAAAAVAGVAVALVLARGEAGVDRQELLAGAARIEGHPDNAAPAVFGGFTVCWPSRHEPLANAEWRWPEESASAGPRLARLDVHPQIRPVVLVPSAAVPTAAARALLPATVPHRDAAANSAAALLLGLAVTSRPDLLLDATEDRLHQGYRAPAMPESAALVERLRRAGHPAVISGAGPSVLVLARGEDESAAVAALRPDRSWRVLTPGVDRSGVQVELLPGS